MIPIRDTVRSKNVPIVNNLLIGLNVLFFLVEISKGPHTQQFIVTWSLIPARYTDPALGNYFTFSQQVLALFTFMFLHGGFLHLLGNMWSLYIFGDNVEDRLGHFRYLVFYLLCGWASGLTHGFFNPHSGVPTIGASGAISGVMGAYFLLYPGARVLTLIPIIIIPYFIEIPAFVFLGLWFLMQFISAAGSSANSTGVAWWAHVGGFVFGMLMLRTFTKMPSLGLSQRVQPITERKTTPRLQIIRSRGDLSDINLYGTLILTPEEAARGTTKLVNIPWGPYNRMFRVRVPENTANGAKLRLQGTGRHAPGHGTGDMILTISIEQ